MKRLAFLRRPRTALGFLLAGVFASASSAHAQPNQFKFTIVQAPSSVSDCFQLPAFDEPVMVEGSQITIGYRGTGFVHATYAMAEGDNVLTWTGVHAEKGTGPSDAVVAGGYSYDGPPAKVVDIGYQGSSYLESCPGDASSLRLHNGLPFTFITVVIKETW